ncbi:four helix bundle protein [Algibacter lectus]|uniref:four helix bundle protein n=2 Tax=Algibacter lectus TaxID=221126 RepID=UPI0026B5E09D|nr:four helix bundle protein [Algibacter lectus]
MSFKTLLAYQKGFDLAMEIFHLTKSFPNSEQYALISQIVRSSRSVCSNIAEGYRKRQYENILKVNYPMRIVKIPKHNYGSILH